MVGGIIGNIIKANSSISGAEVGCQGEVGALCAMAAQRAIDAANYLLLTDRKHYVTLDQVVETLRETGIDMMDKYKETAKGGLAKHLFSC